MISSTGEFTHVKLGSSQDECDKLCDLFIERVKASDRSEMEKMALLYCIFTAKAEGIIPSFLLLELYWPSAKPGVKFKESNGEPPSITFDLPDKFKDKAE